MQPLKIVQINCHDQYGGAEKIALTLHEGYQQRRHEAYFLVNSKHTQKNRVIKLNQKSLFAVGQNHILEDIVIRNNNETRQKLMPLFLKEVRGDQSFPLNRNNYNLSKKALLKFNNKKLNFLLQNPSLLLYKIRERLTGRQIFIYKNTQSLAENLSGNIDILQLHNLHGHYFDLHQLPRITQQIPTVMTLHDMWAFTGFCIHALDCEKWQTGCGECPQIQGKFCYRDASSLNWQIKRDIYQQTKLYLVTPSQWLMNKANQSILQPSIVRSKIIHNGVNLQIFHPREKQIVRQKLNLALDVKIILFAATAIKKNKLKGYFWFRKIIDSVANLEKKLKIKFLAIGDQSVSQNISENVVLEFIPYQADPQSMAQYYQAADLYLHTSTAETFGLAITEAMACKTPVIANNVGGIPEQVIDNYNGYLINLDDHTKIKNIAQKILKILQDSQLSRDFVERGYQQVETKFSSAEMIGSYLDFYDEIITKDFCH